MKAVKKPAKRRPLTKPKVAPEPPAINTLLACDPGSHKMGFALLRRVGGKIELARSWQIGTRGSEDLENRIFDLCLQARPIMRAALEAGARMLVVERSAPINRGGKGIAALQIAWSMGLVCGAIAGTWALSGAPCKYVKVHDWRTSLKGLLNPHEHDYKKPAIELARKFYGINAGEDEAQAIWLGYSCLLNQGLLKKEE